MSSSPCTIALGLLLFSTAVLSEIHISLNYDKGLEEAYAKKFDLRTTINLECRINATAKEKYQAKWIKEGKDKFDDRASQSNEPGLFRIRITGATEHDAGVYACVVSSGTEELARSNITLYSKYRIKTPDSVNVVEGEELKIVCQFSGSPPPTIRWEVGNETYTESRDRVVLEAEKGVPNTIFIIREVVMSDRGTYKCIGTTNMEVEYEDETMVRIKDKYAALWPFLGICAEVFILCAIILIYEKKRNKAELEESDTDQSPDQKNTPDHGKDSNLRHRQ